MGIWIELGIFGLVLVFGIWQIRDVANERRKRETREAAAKPPTDSTQEEAPK